MGFPVAASSALTLSGSPLVLCSSHLKKHLMSVDDAGGKVKRSEGKRPRGAEWWMTASSTVAGFVVARREEGGTRERQDELVSTGCSPKRRLAQHG